ncbi:MAG TPA: tyrosine--tRNA ligase [Gemmatimonadales bacterium]|nr:tyrosine--tRNA ligase [Gemmatimonadales bacterium]
MTGLLADLKWRGFVQDATPGLDAHLAQGPVTVYCGFDPTAPSLQLGNLIPLMLLNQLQRAGHRPIVLMGGGTGLIGDPSGKRAERPLLSKEAASANVERQREQMARFLDFSGGRALLRDNADWLVPARLVDFLRDTGKHFTINVMLQKESVKARLDSGLSFTEFSYMLLQAYDYLQLFEREHCTLQVGGSDQWGNITAGVDLVRRIKGAEVHGLVAPLITTAAGAKFGKSEQGAIYLDPDITSPYRFYQFWVNADDRDIESYLKLFSLRPKDGAEGIDALLRMHKKEPAKREAQYHLAGEVTERVHGKPVAESVVAASAILFSDWDPHRAVPGAFDVLAREIPTAPVNAISLSLVDALVAVQLVKSKSDARRQIEQGGVYVNQQRETDVNRELGPADLLAGRNVVLRKGKKDYGLLRVTQP